MNKIILHSKLLILVIFVLISTAVSVDSKERTDFKVNSNSGSSQQDNPKISVARDGSFAITWVDRRNASADIYLQFYDSSGIEKGFNLLINDDSTNAFQISPAIDIDLLGNYSVVWTDYRDGSYPFDPHIYRQQFASSLNLIGSNGRLTSGGSNVIRETPDIVLTGWGKNIIVWADNRNSNWDIYGQIIADDGSLVGNNFMINDDVNYGQQHAPRISASDDGWFIVAWYDNRWGDDDIFVQRFDAEGNRIGVNLKINTDSNRSRQAFPDITTDGAGHFTVVWVDWRNGTYPTNPDIYSARYDTLLSTQSGNIKVSINNLPTAQIQPSISADRLGNVAIIWADSTSFSWDIIGQMIDVDGRIREANFRANSFGDSTQLNPDVALDGTFRYVTWADKRNGSLDIYASITQYNERILVVTPNSFSLDILDNDTAAYSRTLAIDHAGYNSLSYEIIPPPENWISINKTAGTTPDSVTLTFSKGSNPEGVYEAIIRIVDVEENDSSLTIPVRMNIISPVITIAPDSVYFTSPLGSLSFISSEVTFKSNSTEPIDWKIISTPSWITTNTEAGMTPQTLSLTADPSLLNAAVYVDTIKIESMVASNSPIDLIVVLEITELVPEIALSLDSIYMETQSVFDLDSFVVISNIGTGSLNWTASVSENWVNILPLSGTDNDSIWISGIDTVLTEGIHTAVIEITDSQSLNIFQQLSLVIKILADTTGDTTTPPPPVLVDTVVISALQVAPFESNVLDLYLKAKNDLSKMHLPLSYNDSLIMIDSVTTALDSFSFITFNYSFDSLDQSLTIDMAADNPDSFLTAGEYSLAKIYFTATELAGITSIKSVDSPFFINFNGDTLSPVIIPGEVSSSIPTGINDDNIALPGRLSLEQNYPNPFNLTTSIQFYLPIVSEIELAIYNVLGQKTTVLASGVYSGGSHQVSWDGRFGTEQIAPSGIYFYRLNSDGISIVKKLLLIK